MVANEVTAELIGKAVERSDCGVKLSQEVEDSFTHISEVTSKVRTLIAEVAAASVKQTSGLKQVSSSAAEMESVTQELAANSEESSAAINDLRHQTEHIVDMLGGLQALVMGKRGAQHGHGQTENRGAMAQKQFSKPQRALPASEDF